MTHASILAGTDSRPAPRPWARTRATLAVVHELTARGDSTEDICSTLRITPTALAGLCRRHGLPDLARSAAALDRRRRRAAQRSASGTAKDDARRVTADHSTQPGYRAAALAIDRVAWALRSSPWPEVRRAAQHALTYELRPTDAATMRLLCTSADHLATPGPIARRRAGAAA